MLDFEYYAPTKVLFGKGSENKAVEEIQKIGAKKVLVHFGGESAKASGLFERILRQLKEKDIASVSLGGVKPNPRLGLVYEGIALGRKEQVDFVLAIGGGSVIDSAKAIAVGLANTNDVWDFYEGKASVEKSLPVGVILTIAAAGSETADGSVITKEEGLLKRSCGADIMRPRFAAMNPELTYTLPPYQTACGGADILMHAMERYFTGVENVELTDAISEALMRTVIHNTLIAYKNPLDYNARAELMWAGSMAHSGLMGTGRRGDWATHDMEVELSGMYDITHGAGITALCASWARYVYQNDVARFAQFAVNVMGCPMNFEHPEITALEGIAALEKFYQSLSLPISIHETGIVPTEAEIVEMAKKSTGNDAFQLGGIRELNSDDVANIFRMAL